MLDQSQSTLANIQTGEDEQAICPADRQVLRTLAGKVAQLAARPIEAQKRALWFAHNALQPTRPLIFCDPENGWNEIITSDQMQCTGKLARRWEMHLRKEVFWGQSMGDDRVVEPVFDVGYVACESDWGMHERRIGGEHGGSYTWDAPLKSYDDLDKLHYPQISVDRPASNARLAMAQEILGDLLEVRLASRWWWTLGLTSTLANLRGLEAMMFDMYDHPEELKRLMKILSDGTLAKLDYLEANGLLSSNTDGTYVGSGGFGYSGEIGLSPGGSSNSRGPVRTRQMWGFCESQETTNISADMFAEFVFPYQLPILDRFGLNCYGCCEPLDLRWQVVKHTPHLRRVSVSPWADLEKMAENLGDRHIYSLKPAPSDLAVSPMDEDHVRASLRRAIRIARCCRLEIIMKDNHTLAGNPRHAVRWCQIAQEEAQAI